MKYFFLFLIYLVSHSFLNETLAVETKMFIFDTLTPVYVYIIIILV